MLRSELPIWWSVWWVGATLLVLCLIALNTRRRRSATLTEDAATRAALPTLREDALWGALVFVGGGTGVAVIFWLVTNWHTARALVAGAIFGLLMLLGLVMLLKNGLAPNDILRLDEEPETAEAAASSPEELAQEEVG